MTGVSSLTWSPTGPNTSTHSETVPLPPGYLTSVMVTVVTGGAAETRGRYFVNVVISQNPQILSNADLVTRVWSGYVDGGCASSIPNFHIEAGWCIRGTVHAGTNGVATDVMGVLFVVQNEPRAGGGYIHTEEPGSGRGEVFTLGISNPAAGVNPAYTVPNSVRQNIRNVNATLTCSSATSTRVVQFETTDGANNIWEQSRPSPGVGSGSTSTFSWQDGYPVLETSVDSGGRYRFPRGTAQLLAPGDKFTIGTGGIDGADQWSGVSTSLEEWAYPIP